MNAIIQGKPKPAWQFEHPELEVKVIWKKTGLSQNRFAALIEVSKRTLENGEQGRRHPTSSAKTLLRIGDTDPEHAIRALQNLQS